MRQYPIYFSLSENVIGRGFLVSVHLEGRALVEYEEDAVWICGVNPGGLSDYGSDVSLAMARFRRRIQLVFADLAEDASDHSAFVSAVHDFFSTPDQGALRDWEAARARLRQEGFPEDAPGAGQVERAERPLRVEVALLALMPQSNIIDEAAAPQLAA